MTKASLFLKSDAVISPCGKYRYRLSRVWDENLPLAWWVMLNPSVADAAVDDPTIRRVTGFTEAWGYGGFVVVNLFALRATDPKSLPGATDPAGPENDAHLVQAREAALVVAAWGAWVPGGRDRRALALLAGQPLRCLGTTKSGAPRHPLYVRGDATPAPYPGR